jgi:Concanavalin A-like lectin/glucanases superfamily
MGHKHDEPEFRNRPRLALKTMNLRTQIGSAMILFLLPMHLVSATPLLSSFSDVLWSSEPPGSCLWGALDPYEDDLAADEDRGGGLVLLFHFDEGNGATRFVDASGNANTGTCGVTCPTTGVNGEFDSSILTSGATGNYVSVANSASLGVAHLSISAWVSLTSSQTDGCVATKGFGGGGEAWSLDTSGGNFRFYFWKGGVSFALATDYPAFQPGWTHLVATYDGVTQNVYINGTLNATATPNQGNLTTNTSVVGIGARQDANGSTFDFTSAGLYDEFALYNRALTRSEVAKEYQRGYSRLSRHCAHWRQGQY